MTPNIMKEIQIFCKNLKHLRETNQLTKKEMAQKLNISTKTLATIEQGSLPPRLSTSILIKIHQEFGISPQDMFNPHL